MLGDITSWMFFTDHFFVYYVCYAAGITNGLPDFFNLLFLIDFSTPPFLVPLPSLTCVVQYSTSIVEELRTDNSKPFGHFPLSMLGVVACQVLISCFGTGLSAISLTPV